MQTLVCGRFMFYKATNFTYSKPFSEVIMKLSVDNTPENRHGSFLFM